MKKSYLKELIKEIIEEIMLPSNNDLSIYDDPDEGYQEMALEKIIEITEKDLANPI